MTTLCSLLWLFLSFSLAFLLWLKSKNRSSKSYPPGPPGWPVIGNIFDVGTTPYYNLYKLRAKYGPVLWLKLGMSNNLVIQSAKVAEELFKKHDHVFSDRTIPNSLTACNYDKGSLALAHYGEYWRSVRKLCASELVVPKKVSGSALARRTCIDIMVQWIKEDSIASRCKGGSGEIQLEKYLILMTFNLVANFTMSRDVMDSKSEKGNEFYEVMNTFMYWSGKPNLVDSFPFLKWIDPQGIRRNTGKHLAKLLNIVGGFVKERIQEKKLAKEKETKDFLDALLEFYGEDEVSLHNVNIMVLEMFMAGTETTSSTIHWGMAELMHNPNALRNLKHELDHVIGCSRMVEEDDLNNLPYLNAVVKETMRLHPSLPLLLPRNAMEDTEFMGYFIPKNTMIIVNAWAIHRDPDSWEDPLSFKPERFMDSNINYKGKHYELIPFGSGRRACIGMNLGEKMASLTIAKLIHSFNWKLPANQSPSTMDMRERMGISLRKLVPLIAVPYFHLNENVNH